MSESWMEKRPLQEHLEELLVRLRRVVGWIFLGSIAGYLLAPQIIGHLEAPLHVYRGTEFAPKLIFTQPFEKFWVYLRVSFWTGFCVALPFVVYEVSMFVGPGLKKLEKARLGWLSLSVGVALVAGVALGYVYVLPAVLSAILDFGVAREMPLWTLSSYVSTTLGLLLLCGVFMELPVIMGFVSSWGWVQTATWTKGRRLAIVANAVLAAFLSPPDPLSMIVMMIPIQILYEFGIVLSRVAEWRRGQ